MGTSIEMIERHYGTLLQGAAAGIASSWRRLRPRRSRPRTRLGHYRARATREQRSVWSAIPLVE